MGLKFYRFGRQCDDTVAFPFGYGLSYTSFDQARQRGDKVKVTVTATVTNTGDKAG